MLGSAAIDLLSQSSEHLAGRIEFVELSPLTAIECTDDAGIMPLWLLVDLLHVRRMPSVHVNVGKPLVKSPKTYIRDSGLAHALLGIETLDDLLGHPIAGPSEEGF